MIAPSAWRGGAPVPDFVASQGGRPSVMMDGALPDCPSGALPATLAETYNRQGLAGFGSLRGSFSLVFWTGCKLLLARDPAGRLPLFWRHGPGGLSFASTPKALAQSSSIDPIWASRQLLLLPDRGDATAYLDVRRVLPGEVLAFERPNASPERWRWTPDFDQPLEMFTDSAAGELAWLIDQALDRIRKESDQVALQLSSGLDSAILLSHLGRHRDLHIDCYTASPAASCDAMDDEWELARSAATRFPNAIAHRVDGPSSGLGEAIALFGLFQQPTMNMCNVGWLDALAAKAAADGYGTLIEGLAGNFTVTHGSGGALAALSAQGRWSDFIRKAMASFGKESRTALRRNPPSLLKRRRSRAEEAGYLRASFLRTDSGLLKEQLEVERAMGRSPERVDAIDCPRRRYFEFLQHRDDGLFRHAIRERHGIMLHDPFADADVMDFVFRLPAEAFGSPGSRALGYALLDKRLDQAAIRRGARASQGDNWRMAAERDRKLALELLGWAGDHHTFSTMIDVPAALIAIDEWPQSGWDQAELVDRYRFGLMRTLGIIAFARWAEKGG